MGLRGGRRCSHSARRRMSTACGGRGPTLCTGQGLQISLTTSKDANACGLRNARGNLADIVCHRLVSMDAVKLNKAKRQTGLKSVMSMTWRDVASDVCQAIPRGYLPHLPALGREVQVDPMQPKLNAPGTINLLGHYNLLNRIQVLLSTTPCNPS
jgi:hypothetical protein